MNYNDKIAQIIPAPVGMWVSTQSKDGEQSSVDDVDCLVLIERAFENGVVDTWIEICVLDGEGYAYAGSLFPGSGLGDWKITGCGRGPRPEKPDDSIPF